MITKKNSGFIATSLIYTFFLVFIAILALLLNAFIASKTILDRFNDDVMSSLDSSTYTVSVSVTNADVLNGITLSNLISNGTFNDNNCTFWNIVGSGYACNQMYSGFSSIDKPNSTVSNQNIYLNENNIYYYSLNYLSTNNSNPKTYIDDIKNGYVESKNTYGIWKKDSQLYSTNTTGNKTFHLGVGSTNEHVRYANVLLLDLTSSFDGHEPDKKWLDENIDYFNGTINFIKRDNVKTTDSVRILMNPLRGYNTYTLNCLSSDNTFSKNITEERNNNNVPYKVLTLNSIKANVKCSVEWRKS